MRSRKLIASVVKAGVTVCNFRILSTHSRIPEFKKSSSWQNTFSVSVTRRDLKSKFFIGLNYFEEDCRGMNISLPFSPSQFLEWLYMNQTSIVVIPPLLRFFSPRFWHYQYIFKSRRIIKSYTEKKDLAMNSTFRDDTYKFSILVFH